MGAIDCQQFHVSLLDQVCHLTDPPAQPRSSYKGVKAVLFNQTPILPEGGKIRHEEGAALTSPALPIFYFPASLNKTATSLYPSCGQDLLRNDAD